MVNISSSRSSLIYNILVEELIHNILVEGDMVFNEHLSTNRSDVYDSYTNMGVLTLLKGQSTRADIVGKVR